MEIRFDDIRPYNQDEIAPAMQRIANSEYLPAMTEFVFPGKDIEEIRKMLLSFKTTHDFQIGVMYHFNNQVIKNTTTGLSFSGLEYLDPQKNYLFVSNHRDIVMDSSLLQQILYKNGFRTTEITFGSNLMSSQLVVDIGKSNKMFKVARGENPRDFYKTSLHLSEYIRYTLTTKGESVWIAQRNGRTKDGNDLTDQGIIKMFAMSGGKDLADNLDELKIVPIAISYQWEPCDRFKVRELYQTRNGKKYIKQKDEDLISVLTGIMQPKGKVNINICQPLQKEELQQIAKESPSNEFYKNVATLIDNRIYQNYKLFSTNYIAHDLRSGVNHFIDKYSQQEKEEFIQRFQEISASINDDKETVSKIFLGIYANPIDKGTTLVNN